ncbi:MAG: LapA family protein [Elusimicrobia bacterium]|nr:LapA family protein [Elusimicrobiota bacterium]
MTILQTIIILVVALLAVMFTFQNPHHVQMHFMAWQTGQFPLIALIIVSVLIGVIVAAILSLKSSLKLNRRIRELQFELREVKKDVVKKEPGPPQEQGPGQEDEE